MTNMSRDETDAATQ